MAPNIIDVRAQLPRNGAGGQRNNPGFMGFPAKVGPKQGTIIHYSGPAVDRAEDTLTVLQGYAKYHIATLPEWGIAYHADIGNDGTIRQLRDWDDVLYHCAAWPYNATWYAVHVMIGDGQRATPAQLAAAVALHEYLAARDGFPSSRLKGHQEVSSTACPGSLMGDLVIPYRAGTLVAKETAVSNFVAFPETGRGIQGAFREYWESQGGLRHFGLPLTNEVVEDGRTVQYFERSVFELHPELAAQGYLVQERRVGATAAKAAGYTGPGI